MQEETHNYCKRPRHTLDTDSSSDSSIYRSTSKLWESIKTDYSFLIQDEILDQGGEKDDVLLDSNRECTSIDRCLVLGAELYCWLRKFRERFETRKASRICAYLPSLELCQLQQYESKRRVLFSLAATFLPEVSLAQSARTASSASAAEAAFGGSDPSNSCQSIERTERPTDTPASVQLAELLRRLTSEWDEILRCAQPINPLEDKDKLFEDIRLDLEEINMWLNMLQSSLPNTSSWMTTLDRLTEVQRHSAAKYYQNNLKQVENHVRTLSSASDLLHRVSAASDGAAHQPIKVDELTQSIGHLEAMCHMTWLQLLELTTCLEQNIFNSTRHTTTRLNSVSSQSRKCKETASDEAGALRSGSLGCAARRADNQKLRMRFPSCNIMDNPMEGLSCSNRSAVVTDGRDNRSGARFLSGAKSELLSPPSQKGALESGFESELSPQPHYCFRNKREPNDGESCGLLTIPREPHPPALIRSHSTSALFLMEESRTSNQRDETTGVKSRSKRGNAFEVLAVYDNCPTIPTVPATDVEIPGPLTNTSIDSQDECCLKSAEHSQSSTSDPAIKELPPVNQTEHSLPTDAPEHLSCVVRSSLPGQQPRARANRIKKHSINERNCRSTPVLSTVVPLLYRIAMRKPTRRLLLADTREGKSERLRTDPPGLGRAQFGTGRLRTGADSRQIWRAPGTISRVDKTTEADLEDLSTQEISINTTTPSNDPTDPDKLRDPSMTPTPFVLVRHKSRRLPAAPVARRHRRHPSRRRSQPVLWRHKSRTVTRGSAWLSARTGVARCAPVLPIRAHSFCAPYAHESNKTSVAIKSGHSDSSSIDGDANDPEYKIWQSRVKSYLDAAAQADALVRSQYDPSALKQWLSPNGELRHPEANSSADEGSPRDVVDRQQLRTALSTRMDSTRVVLDYQEPLLTFWDDYQQLCRPRPYSAPLYSSSSDTDGCEPVSTYAEEFPWDDMAASCLSDASQEDLFLREIQASKPKSSPYAPFHSTVTTPANAENGMDQLRVDHDTTEPPVFRQDTMELSTSTSVLFNQKSSSLEASFEVFSHSGTTAETADSPVNESNRPELLLCGLRTHPDGGSQHCLTGDFMNGVAEAIVQTAPEYPGSSPDHDHRYSNPYVMDSRKCQTLPRVSAKRKRRQHLTSGTKAHCAGGESRLSATASLDELHDWNNRRSRLDILRFSRQRLQELRALYNRLLRISPGQREDASPDPYSGMTLDHWQNSLSHVIHLAEANLQLLTDSTVGSVAPSNKCCCRNERDVKSPAVPLQSNSSPSRPHKWSNCPELTCLQLQWVQFTDQARYWLLQSYSQQATRHQLTALKARISDLNQTIQRVLTPSITRSEQPRPVCLSEDSQSKLDVHATDSSHPRSRIRQHDEEIMKRIRYCVNEVEAVGEQVQRLREEFERHVIHSQQQQQQQQNQQLACDQKSVEPTTSFVALRDESLVQELDQLSDQLSANQERLTSLLAMQSDTLTENSSDEQDWEHVDYPTATGQRSENVPEEKVPKTTAPETVTKIEEQTETSAPILLREPSTIVEPTHHHPQYIILVAGGLMALTCFCCYIVAQLIPCENRPCGWRDSLLLLERVFGLSQEAASGACPLRRERLSSLVDYTPGSLPF